ncbi:MAG: ABC transporter ATP-binding protein [Bacteroidota bacterium]|nr:ABC transporter ATP-binding protein [Bacteroidota bacterium]
MIIEINDLTKTYNRSIVLHVDKLNIQPGETIGLVGNNGAGKTTFFRLLVDLIRADKGAVLSKGEAVAHSSHWKDYTASYLDEGFLIEYLTPEEYFDFIGSLQELSKSDVGDLLNRFNDFFNGEILNQRKYIRDLSKGNKNKIGIVAALIQNPEILILDEPFASLDPTTQFRLKVLLKNLHKQAVTTLISSHDLSHVTEVCDRIILLEKGLIIKDFQTNENSLKELETYFAE